jgi:hypothetical protein
MFEKHSFCGSGAKVPAVAHLDSASVSSTNNNMSWMSREVLIKYSAPVFRGMNAWFYFMYYKAAPLTQSHWRSSILTLLVVFSDHALSILQLTSTYIWRDW